LDTIDSAAWYDRHTESFIARTASVDLSHLHQRFLRYLPAGSRILDAGCGSGRDSLVFQQLGYDVVAMDASIAMVEHVRRTLPVTALHLRHQDVAFHEEFDGVWSCAALLHVPHAELPGVLRRYRQALVPNGILFASFKHGDGEHYRDERLFANQNDASFRVVLASVPGLVLLETAIDVGRQPGKEREEWFSVLCRKDAGDW
jgi:2-polyprenyl-3-methyl-5-hydroxy-6-metoxy-1,4-benzoquinol methylase